MGASARGWGCWHGQSGSGSGQIGHATGVRFSLGASMVNLAVGVGRSARRPEAELDGTLGSNFNPPPEPLPMFPPDLNLSTSTIKLAHISSRFFFSDSQPSFSPYISFILPLININSFFMRSLSPFRALATSCSRTFECISSASYCLNRSSRVVI